MAVDIAYIAECYHTRREARQPDINRCMQVARHYDGDVIVPLPELNEYEKSMAVNLLGPGLDALGMAAAVRTPAPLQSSPTPSRVMRGR